MWGMSDAFPSNKITRKSKKVQRLEDRISNYETILNDLHNKAVQDKDYELAHRILVALTEK